MAGNEAVAGRRHALRTGEGLFRYTKELAFVTRDGSGRERLVASEPDAWIDSLVAGGANAFLLNHRESGNTTLEDRLSVVFANGGPAWAIATTGAAGTMLWSGRETLGNRDDPQRRIWLQRYAGSQIAQPPRRSYPQARAALEEALQQIGTFARDEGLEEWSDVFLSALAILNGDRPEREVWGVDMSVFPSLPSDAVGLAAAVERAWVFGGMGSWNDLGFSDSPKRRRYDDVSRALFGAANDALVEAANRSIHAGPAS